MEKHKEHVRWLNANKIRGDAATGSDASLDQCAANFAKLAPQWWSVSVARLRKIRSFCKTCSLPRALREHGGGAGAQRAGSRGCARKKKRGAARSCTARTSATRPCRGRGTRRSPSRPAAPGARVPPRTPAPHEVCREFFAQSQEERKLGLTPLPFMEKDPSGSLRVPFVSVFVSFLLFLFVASEGRGSDSCMLP